MKKIYILICLGLCIIMSSCSNMVCEDIDGMSDTIEQYNQTETAETNIYTESEMIDDTYLREYLVEDSLANFISVSIPVMETDVLNEIIYNFVEEYFCNLGLPKFKLNNVTSDIVLNGSEYTEYCVEIDYRISYSSSDFVSIIFDGYLNHKSAAHPVHLFTTLNVDKNTNERVYFKDYFNLDYETYAVFVEYAKQSLKQIVNESFYENIVFFQERICTYESFINGMKVENEFHVYYTKESIGISYPVSYALGNHIEVEIPINAF